MTTEIELNLSLLPEQQKTFAEQVMRMFPNATPAVEQELLSIYYDTPALDLAQRHMGLRLRRQGNDWVQTLKCGQTGTGGLHTRTELEHMTSTQSLELEQIDHAAMRDFLMGAAIAPLLRPVFATRVRRTLWQIPCANNDLVELALDVGTVECEDRILPVSEIEIELKQGSTEAVFAVAQELAREFALMPQLRSKAERGYRLFTQEAAKPEMAQTPVLETPMTPWQAWQTVMLDCLRHLQFNLLEIGQGDDMEFVHQARVAIRRMRSADKAFSALPAGTNWNGLMTDLQELARKLGAVRDCDVQLHEVLAPAGGHLMKKSVLRAAKEKLQTQREAAMQIVRQELALPATGQLLLQILHCLYQEAPETDTEKNQTLSSFAGDALTRCANAVQKLAMRWEKLNEERRHALRKRVKTLRYVTEFFTSLYPKGKIKSYLASLQSMQQMLGVFNDAAVARLTLSALASELPDAAFDCGMVAGWYAAQAEIALEKAGKALQDLQQAKPFW